MFANAFNFHRTPYKLSEERPRKPYVRLSVAGITPSYGRINLDLVRRALDTVTLEDESAVVKVRITGCYWGRRNTYTGQRRDWFEVSLDPNDGSRVRVKAPCGQTRRYKIKTLDRALLAFGS